MGVLVQGPPPNPTGPGLFLLELSALPLRRAVSGRWPPLGGLPLSKQSAQELLVFQKDQQLGALLGCPHSPCMWTPTVRRHYCEPIPGRHPWAEVVANSGLSS